MAEAAKDTVYIDVDDEITGIIDKVALSKHKIVALVLPKRAAVLQSIVNMKLLKRSGNTHKKQIVLITSESGLLPLAGAVKLHVAKTLQSKPAIPAAPNRMADELDLDDKDAAELEDGPEEITEPKTTSAKAAAVAAAEEPVAKKPPAAEETIELDDEPDAPENAKEDDKKPGKKIKIPNFEKFRTKLLIGSAALIALIVLFVLANVVLPTASILVSTDDTNVTAKVSFTASTAIKEFDAKKMLVPATDSQLKKTDTEKVPATGKKNIGDKAGGTVSLRLTDCSQDKVTVPSGTVVTNNGFNFVTQKEISFRSVILGGECANTDPLATALTTGTVKVVAQSPGDQYNLSGGRSFAVAGFGNISGTDSSAMTGGTTKEVTAVSDQDIETAKNKMADRTKTAATNELKKQIEADKLFALVETLTVDAPVITANPAAGSEASETTVTAAITYHMLGVKRDNLKTLVVNDVKDNIDTKEQTIRNDGLGEAVFRLTDKKSATEQSLSVESTASTGAAIDEEALKKEIAGKKKGQVQDLISSRPGVKDVKVSYSPFWVYKTPSNPAKITLTFENVNDSN